MANQIRVVPINPIDWWKLIHYKELYKGPYEIDPPENFTLERRIPREGWWVCDENGFYLVSRVFDNNTSELTPIYPGQGGNYINVITGPAINQWTSPFRIMVDPSTTPVRFRVDDAMIFRGSEPAYYKVFRGTDITANGRVISTAVNGSGVPTNANLPLELVTGPNTQNVLVKVARGGHLLEIPANQEQCMVVAYRSDGLAVDYRPAVVCYTDNIAPLDLSKRIVVKISLETPYLSPDNPKLIQYPVNMLIDSSVIMGVVTYNDGTIKRLPINGDKFSLYGHEEFVASVPGAMFNLGLSYALSEDEEAWNALGNVPIRSLNEEYFIVAIDPDGNYSAKVFVVPYWDPITGKYKLKWYLYTMQRTTVYDVTDKVVLTPGFVWNGSSYNTKQNLRIGLNMGDVSPSFVDYRFVENLAITLKAPGSNQNQSTYYTIEYDDQYRYGDNLRADATRNPQVPNQFNLDISANCLTVEEWLTKVYQPTEPLFYPDYEDVPPNPTDVTIRDVANTWRRVVPIDDVLNPVTGLTTVFTQGDTLVLEFSALTAEIRLELSMGSMNINLPTV